MLEFLGSFSASPGLHTLRYSELGIQFSLGRTNNLAKMRQTWLKGYATSGKPKTVTNLGLKAFINRLIQSYKDDPSWENPYEPIMEMEIGDFVQRLYPTMPSNRENKLPARRKRVLPVKEEPEEDAPLPIDVALPIPVRAIKREETEEERASKRRRLDSLARRGASPSPSPTPLPSTRGRSGSSRRRKGGSSSSTTTKGPSTTTTTTTKGPEEANADKSDDSTINTEGPKEANADKSDEPVANKPDEPTVNNPGASDVGKLDESTGSGISCEEKSLEIVTARSEKDKGGMDIELMLGDAIAYLETKDVVAIPLTKLEVNKVGSCLPDTLVAITDPDVDQTTLEDKSGRFRKDSVNRFVGAIHTATEEQLEKLLTLAIPKEGEAAPKNREELMALVASYGEDNVYSGEGGDIFVLLTAYHLNRPLIVVDLHKDRLPNTHVIYHDFIFADRAGTSSLSPLLLVRKGDHFEPLLVGPGQKDNLWGLFEGH